MRTFQLTALIFVLAAGVFAENTNTASTTSIPAVTSTPVYTASTPDAVMLPDKAMKEAQRLSRSRTRDSYPGASHEASVVVAAGRNQAREEEPRSGSSPTNRPVEVNGARPAGAPLTPAQLEAQRATGGRKDSPVKSGE